MNTRFLFLLENCTWGEWGEWGACIPDDSCYTTKLETASESNFKPDNRTSIRTTTKYPNEIDASSTGNPIQEGDLKQELTFRTRNIKGRYENFTTSTKIRTNTTNNDHDVSSTSPTTYSPRATSKDGDENHESTTNTRASTTNQRQDESTARLVFDSSCTVGVRKKHRKKTQSKNDQGYCNEEESTESKTCSLTTST